MSVAVIDNGRIAWAEGYGVTQAGTADSVTVETLFQAASISKSISAATVLRLAASGVLDLDADVNDQLRSWRVPAAGPSSPPVTLRHLLGHTAGLNVSGFGGYPVGADVPTTVGVLRGDGNSPALRADTVAGAAYSYSGGGYVAAQLLVEDVTGLPFARVVEREVLDPLGMTASTMAMPLPDALAPNAAIGHDGEGVPLEGRWHVYPETAPSALWSTPTDIARFLLGVQSAAEGGEGAALPTAEIREALRPTVNPRYGLGFELIGEGDSLVVGHTGGNRGYIAFAFLHRASGDGVVVMTNQDEGGGPLAQAITQSVAHVYGWPYPSPEAVAVVDLSRDVLDRFEGRYALEGNEDAVLTVERVEDRLRVHVPGFWDDGQMLWATSPSEFFDMESRATVRFEGEGDDAILVLLERYRARRIR